MKPWDFFKKKKKSQFFEATVEVDLGKTPVVPKELDFLSKRAQELLGNALLTVTTGDLHASIQRLFTELTQLGILQVNTLADNYAKLDRLLCQYDNHHYSEKIIRNKFDELCKNFKFNEYLIYRSIGDDTADRDRNDYFILKIFSLLALKRVIFSNHNAYFITRYEQGFFDQDKTEILHRLDEMEKDNTRADQHRSFINLAKWIADGIVSPREIVQLVETGENNYYKAIRLLDFDANYNNNHIDLYVHSVADFLLLSVIAQYFRTEFSDEMLNKLVESLKNIQIAFAQRLQTKKTHEFSDIDRAQGFNESTLDHNHPVLSLIWSRVATVVDKPKNIKYTDDTRQVRTTLYLPRDRKYSYTIIFGHNGAKFVVTQNNRTDIHYNCLDTDAGKRVVRGGVITKGPIHYYISEAEGAQMKASSSHFVPIIASLNEDMPAAINPEELPRRRSSSQGCPNLCGLFSASSKKSHPSASTLSSRRKFCSVM